jgi:hypothetical protein
MLNALLREVAHEDAQLDGAALEERVMIAWDECHGATAAPHTTTHSRVWVIGGIAAAVVIALAVPRMPMAERTPVADPTPVADLAPRADRTPRVDPPRRADLTSRADRKVGATDAAVVAPTLKSARSEALSRATRAESDTITFVPLGPMAAEDLSGSFQIVHVQIPRASLGALAPTLDMSRASELIETDVLLGEDGMARAIRVSSNDTNYPWRSR